MEGLLTLREGKKKGEVGEEEVRWLQVGCLLVRWLLLELREGMSERTMARRTGGHDARFCEI